MRVAIQTLGTRGDVQPYVALAVQLARRGHDVQIAGPSQLSAIAEEHGIPYAPLPGEYLSLLETPEGKAAIAGGEGFSAGLKLLKHIRPLMWRVLDAEWAAVRAFEPDVIVHHPKSIAAAHMAEAIGCRHILASPLPGFTPTSAFPSPILPFASLGPFNRVSHFAAILAPSLLFRGLLREWRQTSLGLTGGTARGASSGTLYAYSRHVVPVPSDWDSSVLVSGYWFLDSGNARLPEYLSAFLRAGEPPIYVGFGSMPGLDPTGLAGIVLEALARTGRRGVLATGGGALATDNAPAHVRIICEAPHEILLPLTHGAIHHGGAGTTGAVLRAGIPAAICPFFGDQPFWARRVAELGLGPPPLDRKRLSVSDVAAAISAMSDTGVRARATAMGMRIRDEDGVAAAAAFIERKAGPNVGHGAPARTRKGSCS